MIAGDPGALDRFVRLVAPRAWGIFRHHFRFDHAMAEDLFQQLFLHLAEDGCRRLASFRGESSFQTWFARVCRNFAVDHLRADPWAGRRLDPDPDVPGDPLDTLAGAPDCVDAARVAELRERVSELLAFLPEGQRAVVELYYREGLDYREIAERTGDSVSNVGVKLSRARAMLKRLVAAHMPGLAHEFDDE